METNHNIPPDWREWRRFRALHLKQQGWYRRDIAEALGVSAVSRQPLVRPCPRRRAPRPCALDPGPGRPPKLSSAQKRLIPEFLWHGPEAYGFRGRSGPVPASPGSSRRSSASATTRTTSAGCSRNCAGRPKVPIRRAIQRDEEAIRRWRDEVWPELRRRARRERRVLVFEDESGFYLLPGVVRTYAPEGADAGPPREADARPPVGHGRDDARGQGLHPGTAGVAQRAAQHRVPPAPAARGGGAAVGDLGRLADPPPGGGQRVRVRARAARSGWRRCRDTPRT